jgi:diguanylate cyclase (GGDEF)-like protein
MKQLRLWQNLASIALGVTAAVGSLHLAGVMQFLELATLNQWFRLRPPEARTVPIVLVTIQEPDIQWAQRWPPSDRQLATLLHRIHQGRPIAIGLNLYRNIPIEPGHAELLKAFQVIPNVIGSQKAIGNPTGPAVPPPAILRDRNQVGINDLILDADGVVRRNLLSVGQEKQAIPALGTKMALLYLQRQGITAKASAGFNQVTLGKATFSRLTANMGGYVQADTGGFQTLANFVRVAGGIPAVSFQAVMTNQVPPSFFRDKLVFIGVKAESTWGDRFYTPFTTDSTTTWAGVEIHANVAAQLILSALDNRIVFKGLPESGHWLWIAFWAGYGTLLGWSLRCLGTAIALIPLSLISIFGIAYSAFLLGWWVITIPPALAFFSAVLISRGYWAWAALKTANQLLEAKVLERTHELLEKNQALEQARHAAEAANLALERLARLDELTQVANRRSLNEYLQDQWQRMQQAQLPLALILIDVDFFKLYNDTYGHPAGDACLVQVAQSLKIAVQRSTDLVARYGGEEFAIVLPNTTLAGMQQVVHTVQTQMQQLAMPHARSQVSPIVTLSLGAVWGLPTRETPPSVLIEMADQALYQAKVAGRDRLVVTELPLQPPTPFKQ